MTGPFSGRSNTFTCVRKRHNVPDVEYVTEDIFHMNKKCWDIRHTCIELTGPWWSALQWKENGLPLSCECTLVYVCENVHANVQQTQSALVM